MDDDLRALCDERDVRRIVLDYFRGIDRRDRALVASCYHEGASEVHGSFDGPAEEFVEWAWRLVPRYEWTAHYVAQQFVDLRGDRAHVETYGTAVHEGEPHSDPSRNLTIGFRFLDRFERRAGRWGIVRRVAVTDWCRLWDPATRWEVADSLLTGRPGSDDPLYESLAWLDGAPASPAPQ